MATDDGNECSVLLLVLALAVEGRERKWNATPVPMSDVNDVGDPRLDRRSLSPAAALSLMLHYLCSSMPEHSL
ncbi:hypothetical protein F444_20001 [Phytophthora nicotianae P1976]|uniref:PiggyBac transposable element-derived protein domain-containing protein n=1 Tax=Phytophthora nicotianae P1976 TaxID=1317066 RepID=A0A080Z5Z6_PHYNI|nr:hypothetical protein F444_20001 [Phytophthora nicotianae P1976]